MKALSLWQPWATLWVRGPKIIETRGWTTKYRGPLLVHAAKRFQRDEKELCQCEPFRRCLGEYHAKIGGIPLGAILGKVNLCDCVRVETVRDHLSEQEKAFGNYSDGRWALLTDSRTAFPVAIPWRGQQGFFDVDEADLKCVGNRVSGRGRRELQICMNLR